MNEAHCPDELPNIFWNFTYRTATPTLSCNIVIHRWEIILPPIIKLSKPKGRKSALDVDYCRNLVWTMFSCWNTVPFLHATAQFNLNYNQIIN